jgi:hypothetical protein
MKRERRQELKTNELSIQLQRFSDYIQQRASTLIAVGVGVVLVVGALLYRSHAAAQAKEQGWAALFDALRVDRTAADWVPKQVQRFRDLSLAYDDPQLTRQARMMLVDLCLEEVPSAESPDLKTQLLDTAEDTARTVLGASDKDVPMKAAALNWLATIEEDRFAIDQDKARKAKAHDFLERIRNGEEFRGTVFQEDVLQRLNNYDALWEPVVLADPPPAPPAESVGGEPEASSPEASVAPMIRVTPVKPEPSNEPRAPAPTGTEKPQPPESDEDKPEPEDNSQPDGGPQ